MSRGRYLSLEEARNEDDLLRFAKEHPTDGDEDAFDELLERMAKSSEEAE